MSSLIVVVSIGHCFQKTKFKKSDAELLSVAAIDAKGINAIAANIKQGKKNFAIEIITNLKKLQIHR